MSLDLNKQKVLDLKKSRGIDGQLAQVVFCVDFSGSMTGLYNNGTVQRVLERLFPVAMAFDDNQSMDFVLFQNDYHVCPEVTPNNIQNYVAKIALQENYNMGGTSYAPSLNEVILPMVTNIIESTSGGGFLGFGKTTTRTTQMKKVQHPVYVIFLTDGDCGDKTDTYNIVRELSATGVFIQFVGIGSASFDTLEKLDDLSGRVLDNANFFAIENLDTMSDDHLYSLLMAEFPEWITQARSKWFIN